MSDTMMLVTIVSIGLIFTSFALTYKEFRKMSERRYARAGRRSTADTGRARSPR